MPPLTTTVVPPWRQGAFKDWLQRNNVTDYLHPQSFYDYGGAFMSGLNRDPVTQHWPDTFKQPGHPTFSDQSQYADSTAGHWSNGEYMPPVSFLDAAHGALGIEPPTPTPGPTPPRVSPLINILRQMADASLAPIRSAPVPRPAPQPLIGDVSLSPELRITGAPAEPPVMRAQPGYELPQLNDQARIQTELEPMLNMIMASMGPEGRMGAPGALERAILGTKGGAGFTLTREGQPFMGSAFMVAEPKLTQMIDELTPENVRKFVTRPDVRGALDEGGLLGGWRDPATGQLEINVSKPHPTLETAIPHAQQGNQLAIGHLSGGAYSEIPTPPSAAIIDPKSFIREAHNILGIEPRPESVTRPAAAPRIAPTPGAVFNKGQPFETQQLTKPLGEHTDEELSALQTKIERAQQRFDANPDAIGNHQAPAYDLQVLADERARRSPLSRRLVPDQPAGRPVYHGTTAPDFSIPSRSNDIGVHVGTPGQASNIVAADPEIQNAGAMFGARVIPLLDSSNNPVKLTRDLGNWEPYSLVNQLVDDGYLSDKQAMKLTDKFDTFGSAQQRDLIKKELQKRGYDSIEYPNKYEVSGTGQDEYGQFPIYEPSRILLDPAKHLRNPLLAEGNLLKRPYPAGMPRVLGGELPESELRDLAFAHLGDVGAGAGVMTPERLARDLQSSFPAYANYISPDVVKKVQQIQKPFHAFLRNMRPEGEISAKFNSPAGQAIRHWYEGWKGAVGEALPPDAAEMLTRFSAILSAQKSPEDEVGMALAALDQWAHGEPIHTGAYLRTTPEREKQMALAAKDQRWGKRAHKTSGYYLARKGFKQTGALDRHVIRAYTGTDRVTPAQYEVLWHKVDADARAAGVPFDEFQAGVWGGQTGYARAAGESGAAPEDWLAYHLSSGKFDRLLEKYPSLEKFVERSAVQAEGAAAPQGAADFGF